MKPILFSTPMVQAILAGNKTQTRRIIKPQPIDHNHLDYIEADWKNELPHYVTSESAPNEYWCKFCGEGVDMSGHSAYKSKYQIRDILWVRETSYNTGSGYVFKADKSSTELATFKEWGFKWKPSIFMPKEAARIFLKVTDIRVERLQDISDTDSLNEGIEILQPNEVPYRDYYPHIKYKELWNNINGKDSWDLNPWVWVISFERVMI